jgi:hypothetical protein
MIPSRETCWDLPWSLAPFRASEGHARLFRLLLGEEFGVKLPCASFFGEKERRELLCGHGEGRDQGGKACGAPGIAVSDKPGFSRGAGPTDSDAVPPALRPRPRSLPPPSLPVATVAVDPVPPHRLRAVLRKHPCASR